MKRSRAIALLLIGLSAIGGYALWCARPFYQRPPLRFDAAISDEMRDYVTAWNDEVSYFKPEKFRWRRWGESLCLPYQPNIRPVSIAKVPGGIFAEDEHVIASHPSQRAPVEFWKNRYGWDCPSIQFPGPAGFTTRPRKWRSPSSMSDELPEIFRMPPPMPWPKAPPADEGP